MWRARSGASQCLMQEAAPYEVVRPADSDRLALDIGIVVALLLAIWSASRLYVMARSA